MQVQRQYRWKSIQEGDPTLVRAFVGAADKETQFPCPVEDVLEGHRIKVLIARVPRRPIDPLLNRLTELQNSINRVRESVETADTWIGILGQGSERSSQWEKFRSAQLRKLSALQDTFWELNCPDPAARVTERFAEAQAYRLTRDSRRKKREELSVAALTGEPSAPNFEQIAQVRWPLVVGPPDRLRVAISDVRLSPLTFLTVSHETWVR